MKISVIGTGKTGSKVVDLLGGDLLDTFDENNPPTVDKLKKADAIIIFRMRQLFSINSFCALLQAPPPNQHRAKTNKSGS